MKVLIPGISGAIGQQVALQLMAKGHTVIGIDRRPWPNAPEGLELHAVDIRKRAAEDVFRKHRPDAVIHLGTVTHLLRRSDDQLRINLGGTRAVFDHCSAYGVKSVVWVGRHTFYGAAADSPLYHTEDEPPLEVATFPELADLVAADLYAASALWRLPAITTSVLRICYSLGPARQGTLASFVRGPQVPTIMGFDPLFQFLHEHDAARAIVMALESQIRGVYNVAGPTPVPLSVIIESTGRQQIPIPEIVFAFALGRFGLPKLPRAALTHIKYPVVVDDRAFRKATGYVPQYDEDECMKSFVRGA